MAHRVEHDTHVESFTSIIEVGVASRDFGEYFIAPQIASKKRRLAQLVEAIADFFERPVWGCESDERHVWV
jgi:hypothetical protein